jgi:hypothetical protein
MYLKMISKVLSCQFNYFNQLYMLIKSNNMMRKSILQIYD